MTPPGVTQASNPFSQTGGIFMRRVDFPYVPLLKIPLKCYDWRNKALRGRIRSQISVWGKLKMSPSNYHQYVSGAALPSPKQWESLVTQTGTNKNHRLSLDFFLSFPRSSFAVLGPQYIPFSPTFSTAYLVNFRLYICNLHWLMTLHTEVYVVFTLPTYEHLFQKICYAILQDTKGLGVMLL